MNKPWSVPARGKTLRHIGLALLALLSSAHAAGQALPASYAQGASTGYRVENCTALGAAYPWRDIGATGTAVSLGDDHVSGNIPLGFSFGFGGGGYTRLRIGSNGMLFFDAASTAWANAALPLAGLNAVLLPYWDDLNPAGVAGRIRHQTLGAAPNRVFVVSYLAVPHYCSGGSGCSGNQTTGITETFQVQLHETAGEIVFFYRAMSTFGGGWTAGPVPAGGLPEAGATIGIEVNNTDFIQYSFNANSISNGSVLVFSPIASAPRCSSLNHLRIEHAGSGVTCTPTTLTLRACADAACSAPFTGGVSGTLTATGTPTVNWVGGTGFTIPAGSGSVTKNAQVTTAGTVSWSATGLIPPVTAAPRCFVGATESCSFTAALAGFLFDVPHHAAGVVQNVQVSAVRQADNSLACAPAFTGSRTVNFACGYADPAAGTRPVVVGGTPLACGASPVGIPLSFNASGIASTTLRYDDVGRISLSAGFTGSGSEAGLVMSGSDGFIAVPHNFGVTPGGPDPYVAGNNFTVTVAARNASNVTTPNFGRESTTENVVLGHALVGPAGGNDPALTGTTALADAAFQGGNGAASTSVAWGEVGDISLTATLANYLGSGLGATGSAAAGPFRPARFETVVTPGTGSFTYSGQPFAVEITARNAAGAPTLNYQGAYARAVTLADANSATNLSGTLGSLANTAVAAAAFSGGVATANTVTYTFANKTTAPLETPSSAPLSLRATDADGVSSSGNVAWEGTTPIRAGRLRLINTYGSELLPARVEYRAEFWDGGRWVLNAPDNSAPVAAANLAPGGLTVNALTGLTGGSGFITFNIAAAGYHDIAFNLNPSGANTACVATPGGTPAGRPWLQGHWATPANCGGVAAWAQDPNARIRLGSPRAPYIYLRERY